ncbi:hypothetical protein [Kitasatospora aureofaciens]|uniref:hypothetical protein n=1 Tax=Kitasatospora aureofaciens TaxID=1894 RepID=UPI00210B327F|nr:hypothetical protein [Kitasatospora aureofaciens]
MGSRRQGGVTPTVYVSVDVEADGPIPGPYSMVSFGAVVAVLFADLLEWGGLPERDGATAPRG